MSLEFDVSILDNVPQLLHRGICRRIKNELIVIKNQYDNILVTSDNEELNVIFRKKNNNYTFIINNNYPFDPPKLKINDQGSYEFFNLRTNKFKNTLKYISGIECMCCNTYLCKNNWSPKITLDKIVDQIEYYKKIKYFIFIKHIVDKIKETYLNKDIDLESWLFIPPI